MSGRAAPIRIALAIVLLVAGLAAVKLGYDRYAETYVVARDDDGAAIDRVVRATFAQSAALKVGTLSGTVQSTASDVRWGGWLRSDRVIKAPFTVDYFVDVARLSPRDYRWDAARRRLTLQVPDVTVARANVDESALSVNVTRGAIVTRGAADALARQVSLDARRTAQREAAKPDHIAAARATARRGLARLLGGALAAARVGDVEVAIVFPFERRGDGERWDTTRSIGEVLGNRR